MVTQRLQSIGALFATAPRFIAVVLLLVVGLAAVFVSAQEEDPDVQAMIENTMSAAPPAISSEATILNVDGSVLREGTNGWTCHPDWDVSPGNDPVCTDAVWEALFAAMATGEEFTNTEFGLAYMLQGGSDPSNTDPMALEPAEGEDWITTPPHLMLRLPSGYDLSEFSTDHSSGQPYVMWAGTPYEHIMVPVALEGHEDME
jgi:hypothetical protein